MAMKIILCPVFKNTIFIFTAAEKNLNKILITESASQNLLCKNK